MMKKMDTILWQMRKQVLAVVAFIVLGFSSAGFGAFNNTVNLISVNPGFEEGGQGWYTGGGTIDDTEASEGTHSAKQETDGSSRDWRSQGYSDITIGQVYQFAFDYKTAEGSTGNLQYRFRFFSNGGDFKGESQGTLDLTDGEWVSVTSEYTCPDGADYFDIFLSANLFDTPFSGSAWYDNVAVHPYVDDNLAINPDPADGEIDVPVDTSLSWNKPSTQQEGYSLYLAEGADPNWTLITTPTWTTDDPNEISFTPQEELKAGVTYSWRVDTSITGDVWSFTTIPPTAYSPDPADGETAVSPLRVCSWGSVPGAVSYDVYWGSDEELVTNGDASVYQGNQAGTTFSPEMDFTTEYFWRIDSILTDSVATGNIWSYTTDQRICDPVMAGDVNNDCVVNIADFAIMAADWLNCTLSNGICD